MQEESNNGFVEESQQTLQTNKQTKKDSKIPAILVLLITKKSAPEMTAVQQPTCHPEGPANPLGLFLVVHITGIHHT